MRIPPRLSIIGLMTVVLVASFGLAALRSGTAMWAGGFYLLTYGVLILAIVGAACRGASERAWWLGFALFGFAYLRGAFAFGHAIPKLPTSALLDVIRPDDVDPYSKMYYAVFDAPNGYYWVVGHCLWSLLVATIGGGLARALFGARVGPSVDRDRGPGREDRPAGAGWGRFAAVGLAGLVTVTALVLVGPRADPALWAGAVYLVTWVLLGIAALEFACGRGKRRMIWLGAASFGLGYLVMNRSADFRPHWIPTTRLEDGYERGSFGHLVAEQSLIALRPWLPPVVSDFPPETAAVATANARIRKALDQPVPMTFPDPTPLEDVLRHIRAATRAPDGREIPIYVDPIGLREAERRIPECVRTMQSPIRINLEVQPLSMTLSHALRQLMVYYVRNGMVYITDVNSEDALNEVDNERLLGHCLLALLAAGLGAWLVPLVSGPRDRQPG